MEWTLRVDYQLLIVRTVLAAVALAILVVGWRRRSGAAGLGLTKRARVALGVVAALVFSSAYGFFVFRHPAGIQTHDAYHYYLNAKYFPELGYFDLYRCTVAAVAEDMGSPQRMRIRDLRDFLETTVIDSATLAPQCDGAFTPERWEAFKIDLRWFGGSFVEGQWKKILKDQGYNPSPVWTLVGRPVASLVTADDASMRALARIDLLLLIASFACVGWAFGFEVLCIAVIIWATNPLGRYLWIGDAFLRQTWFSACVIGICLLRKQHYRGAGALLAFSALLRVFPALVIASYGLGALRSWLRGDGFGEGFRDFVVAAAITTVLLPALAVPVSGRGVEVLSEFASNIGPWSQITPTNSVGLPALLSYTEKVPEKELVEGKMVRTQAGKQRLRNEVAASRRPIQLAVVGLFLFFLWKACGNARPWEAACLGFVLMSILIDIPAYYTGFVVLPALLSERRPAIGIATLATMIAICVVTLTWWNEAFLWAAASPLLLLLALYTLLEMGQEPAVPDASTTV